MDGARAQAQDVRTPFERWKNALFFHREGCDRATRRSRIGSQLRKLVKVVLLPLRGADTGEKLG